jgi:outer membrane protein assembly factor BamE
MRFLASFTLLAALAVFAAGCVHKIDVQQGNYVPEDLAAKVQVGMTKPQVRALLGTPLLNDIFHANRWDYYFSNVKGRRAEERTRFSVFFENDKVVRFEGKARPALPPPVVATPAAPAKDAPAGAAKPPAAAQPPAAANPAASSNSPSVPPGAPTPTSPPKQ